MSHWVVFQHSYCSIFGKFDFPILEMKDLLSTMNSIEAVLGTLEAQSDTLNKEVSSMTQSLATALPLVGHSLK